MTSYLITVNGLINSRGVHLILGGVKIEKGLYSHNFNKLKKTNTLSVKTSREFQRSIISTPSIDTSRDPYLSFKSQH